MIKRIDAPDGSYILKADEGYELALKDEKGNTTNRTKEVCVLKEGTLNTWEEVDELPPEPAIVEDPKQQEIADLEAKLAQLKAEVQTQ